MTTEYVVSLTEYDFSTCETVRTWQEVWPSLESLEYATWDQASCEVACETRAVSPSSGCCGGVLPSSASGSGSNSLVVEYTTFNFATCEVTSRSCDVVHLCDPTVPNCVACTVAPRFWGMTVSGVTTPTVPPDYGPLNECPLLDGDWILEYSHREPGVNGDCLWYSDYALLSTCGDAIPVRWQLRLHNALGYPSYRNRWTLSIAGNADYVADFPLTPCRVLAAGDYFDPTSNVPLNCVTPLTISVTGSYCTFGGVFGGSVPVTLTPIEP